MKKGVRVVGDVGGGWSENKEEGGQSEGGERCRSRVVGEWSSVVGEWRRFDLGWRRLWRFDLGMEE